MSNIIVEPRIRDCIKSYINSLPEHKEHNLYDAIGCPCPCIRELSYSSSYSWIPGKGIGDRRGGLCCVLFRTKEGVVECVSELFIDNNKGVD